MQSIHICLFQQLNIVYNLFHLGKGAEGLIMFRIISMKYPSCRNTLELLIIQDDTKRHQVHPIFPGLTAC